MLTNAGSTAHKFVGQMLFILQPCKSNNDTHVATHFVLCVLCRHRSAAFLQPQDPRFFDAGSAAVAIYDYSIEARRVAAAS